MNSDCQSLGHFFRVWTQIFIRVSNLRFTSCINSGFFSAIVSIPGFSQQLLIVNFLVFYKAQLRFKTQVFNLQMLTQTEFENSQNSYFRPKKGHISSLPQLTWPKLNFTTRSPLEYQAVSNEFRFSDSLDKKLTFANVFL